MKTKSAVLGSMIFFSVAASAAPNLAPSASHPFIVGGTEVSANDPIAQTVVGILQQSMFGTALCTGSIIGNDMIVTAAHCVSDESGQPVDASQLTVAYGLNILSSGIQKSQVKSFKVFEGYQSQMNNPVDEGDIAVIRIQGQIPSNYHVVNLLTSDSALQNGGMVTLAGYGITAGGTQDGAGTLRKVDNIPIANANLGKTEVVLDQSSGHGACHGDSGGPGYLTDGNGKLLLWGLTDRGYPDNAPDDCVHEAVYTKVTAYSDWIQGASKALESLN